MQTMYGPAIRDAIASGELAKMEAAASQARQMLQEQGDLKAALADLEASIAKLKAQK